MRHRRRGKKYALKTVVLSGKTFVCQGYEPFVLKRLVKKFGVKDILSQFDKGFEDIHGGRTWYRPDFYIVSRKDYVEVKSLWTLLGKNSYFKKCVRKAKAAIVAKKKVVLLVAFPNKQLIIKLPDDWYSQTRLTVQNWIEARTK
jgi:hypothetical protein